RVPEPKTPAAPWPAPATPVLAGLTHNTASGGAVSIAHSCKSRRADSAPLVEPGPQSPSLGWSPTSQSGTRHQRGHESQPPGLRSEDPGDPRADQTVALDTVAPGSHCRHSLWC